MRVGGAGKLFGTDGVRGIANKELTVEMAVNLGRVMGTLKGGQIAVGMDTRLSSPMIRSAAIAGLLSTGSDAVDLGIAPTPAVQYYIKCKENVNGGIMVTASHNPREYNGIKFLQEDGTEFTRKMDEKSEEIYMSGKYKIAEWSKVGKIMLDNCCGIYINGIISRIESEKIRKKEYKVVVDCGNGAACFTTPLLLSKLGCKVISLNCHPDGRFPARNPEPTDENVEDLKRTVKSVGADLGIAHDGDGDRAVFVDEKGRFISEDIMLALVAKYYVEEKGGCVVTPVSSSRCLEDVVLEAGGKVVYTAVGSPVVAEVMKKKNATFGGEGNGGFIFPEHQHVRDGGFAAAKVLELMAREDKKISELVKKIPKYYMIKTKVPCKDKIKLLEGLKSEFPEANLTDGARLDFEDGWLLIRPSGTEPIARIFAEGKTERKAKELLEFGLNTVKKIMSQ